MKRNGIFARQMYGNVLLLAAVLLLFMWTARRMEGESSEAYYNNARLLLAEELRGYAQGETIGKRYDYVLLDLKGKVIESRNVPGFRVGELVNLTEVLQVDNSFYKDNLDKVKFSFPLYRGSGVYRFIVFYIDKVLVQSRSAAAVCYYIYGPAGAAVLLLLFFLFFRSFLLKKQIMNPVNEIALSSKAIIEGNYEVQVGSTQHLLSSEMDELTYGFELMRDELKVRQEREEQLKRTHKELISCISHDLKTPISTIKAYTEALRDGLAGDEAKRTRYIDTILLKTDILTKMMKDLLEHSNAELNELKILPEECYFKNYFDRLLAELEPYVRQRGIQFISANELPKVLVCVDETRITQVLYNLVENSMKYISRIDGKIMVTAIYDPLGKQIHILVRDNGCGIGMEDIPYVFNKFYRAEKSRSTRIPGSGLGLSICKYIIDFHGGNITCSSRLGEGTEFQITLPVS